MLAWPQVIVIPYAVAVGAVVGSFLNVVIYRLPRGLSIVSPRSACPACSTPIPWYDNIPVLSWLLLRARCRSCATAISVRYPLVELAGAAVAGLGVWRYGLGLVALEVVVFAWIALALALIDYDHQILPDVITYPSIVLGLAASSIGGLVPLLDSIAGAAVGALLPITVIVTYKLIRGEEGMGWGDVKYLAAIGAVVGLRDCLWILICAAVLGALVGGALIALGRGTSRTALPFGTFLAMAVIVRLYAPLSWIAWSLV